MHKTIAVDLDGVIYDFGQALYTELLVYSKVNCSYEDFWTTKCHEYSALWWDNYCKTEFLYGSQVPDRETLKLLNDLSETYKIYYITARPKEVKFATDQYLKHHNFPQRENLIFTTEKALACNSLGVTLMVEDQKKYIDNLLDNDIEVVVHNQIWNRGFDFPCKRINHFTELRSILC